MNNHYDIQKDWVDIPKEDYLEYLLNNYPKNMFYIDRCPAVVSSAEKYIQFDMVYHEALKGNEEKKDFLINEKKFQNVMVKLWLYNTVSVEFSGKRIIMGNKNKIIDRRFRGCFKQVQKKLLASNTLQVEKKLELELFTLVSIRDAVAISFYFKEYEMIVYPYWSYFIVYLNDLSRKEIVKEIVTTEGLYIRDVI